MKKPKIYFIGGSFLSFSADDVIMLDKEWRTHGRAIGSLSTQSHQNTTFGLPVLFTLEQTRHLFNLGVIEMLTGQPVKETTEEMKEMYAAHKTREERLQKEEYRNRRRREILSHKNEIIQGRRRHRIRKRSLSEDHVDKQHQQSAEDRSSSSDPYVPSLTDETVPPFSTADDSTATATGIIIDVAAVGAISSGDAETRVSPAATLSPPSITGQISSKNEENDDEKSVETVDDLDIDAEVEKSMSLAQSGYFITIPTESIWWQNNEAANPKEVFGDITSSRSQLKMRVYEDLWSKGFYLTSAAKFGGDFLVYPGTPLAYHASFIAICLDYDEDIPLMNLISHGRLGGSVRKTTLYCSITNDQGSLTYTSLQWAAVTS